jgi:hypothetical protein
MTLAGFVLSLSQTPQYCAGPVRCVEWRARVGRSKAQGGMNDVMTACVHGALRPTARGTTCVAEEIRPCSESVQEAHALQQRAKLSGLPLGPQETARGLQRSSQLARPVVRNELMRATERRVHPHVVTSTVCPKEVALRAAEPRAKRIAAVMRTIVQHPAAPGSTRHVFPHARCHAHVLPEAV